MIAPVFNIKVRIEVLAGLLTNKNQPTEICVTANCMTQETPQRCQSSINL